MALGLLRDIRAAYRNLDSETVRKASESTVGIGLAASSAEGYLAMERFLIPPNVPEEDRLRAARCVHRASDPLARGHYDIEIRDQSLPRAENAFVFYENNPEKMVKEILARHSDLELPLARTFEPFRKPVVDAIVFRISRENAMFAVATALPDVIPNLFELPWSVAEFATDTAFLTINQVRMAFLVAAASGHPIGLAEQKGAVAMIVAGAFGWRAVARELIGKIPLGGGLIPKGAVAFAGTYVVGQALEQVYRSGDRMSHNEQREAYRQAMEKGKGVAGALIDGLKSGLGRKITA